ncbi:TrbC/VirB2 family protein [Candidatus Woesearchaeota archaeon]|nr:TrbC/VirB2 family protein [Candidatus Woesearchaeota archaeon]
MKKLAPIFFLLLLVAVHVVLADIDFDKDLTADEKQKFDEILSPVMKIYEFIKYAATVAGVLMLVFSGISFVTSGGDTGKKERAKNMAVGVVIGLIVIWVAPLVVKYIFV